MSNGLLAAIFFFQLLLLLLLRPTVSENFEKWQNAIDESKPEWSWPKNTWLPCGALQWHQKKKSKQRYSQKGAYSSAGRGLGGVGGESGLRAGYRPSVSAYNIPKRKVVYVIFLCFFFFFVYHPCSISFFCFSVFFPAFFEASSLR